MKRAQSDIVDSSAAKSHELRYHIHNLGGIKNTVYGGLVYNIGRRK